MYELLQGKQYKENESLMHMNECIGQFNRENVLINNYII